MKMFYLIWLSLVIGSSPCESFADSNAFAAGKGEIIYMERAFADKGNPSLRVAMEQLRMNGVDYCRAIYASFMGKKFINGARMGTLEPCKKQLIPHEGRLNFVVPLSGWNSDKYDLYWLPIPEKPTENDSIEFTEHSKPQSFHVKFTGINWHQVSPEEVMKKFPFDEQNQEKPDFVF